MPDEHSVDAVEADEGEQGIKLKEYAGQWVAVSDRAVVESASTLDELLECVEGQEQRVKIFLVSTVAQATRVASARQLDVGEYGRLVAAGALEGEPVELLAGVLVDMSPQSPGHAAALRRVMRHLEGAPGWSQSQLPLEIPPNSVPEPDLALLAEEPPAGRHPRTALLVVEVAVSSHEIDRGVKVRLYASAGVPVYWLVDVPGRTIEVRTEPTAEGYRHCESYGVGAQVPVPAPGVAPLDVAWVFERVVGR